jgi:hypothetical protein
LSLSSDTFTDQGSHGPERQPRGVGAAPGRAAA